MDEKLESIVSDREEGIDVLRPEKWLLRRPRHRKREEDPGLGPVWSLELLGQIFDDMGPNYVLESLGSSLQEDYLVRFVLVLSFADSYLRQMSILARNLDADLLHPSQEYEDVGIKPEKLLDESLLFIALGKLQ